MMQIWERRTARRLFLTANSILWGNAHHDPRQGIAPSSDGNAYSEMNVRYATALLDAVADGRDVGFDAVEARTRANGILVKVLARQQRVSPKDGTAAIYRHAGPDSMLLTPASGRDVLLGLLGYLNQHADRLRLTREAKQAVRAALDAVFAAQVERMHSIAAKARRDPVNVPIPPTVQDWLARLERILGKPYHWTDVVPDQVDDFLEEEIGGKWPIPVFLCGSLPVCERTLCYVNGHIPAMFFKGERKGPPGSNLPVILIGGWQVQFKVHPGVGGFGDEPSFSTRPPSYAPSGNNSNQPIQPPAFELESGIPDYRNFYGLGTMLRCAAGYDYVTWDQSQPGGPIQIAVKELCAVIEKTKELYGVTKVILVCHSRGGLVARKCILDLWQQHQEINVEKLITYGTPHLGAALATVGEDILTETVPGLLLAALLFTPDLALLPSEILDTIGQLFGQSVEEQIQDQILDLATPLLTGVWPNFAGFVASAEEFKPGSPFIQELNDGYAAANVPVKGQQLSLWEAINHVLIAGTSPDFLTIYLGSWLASLSLEGLAAAGIPSVGFTTINIFGGKITVPWSYYPWRWHWHPIVRLVSDVIPLIPELAVLDTFKEGRGDAVVERSSALADGVVGVRRAEFHLDHLNLKANNDQVTIYESPVGVRQVNPWQVLFLELGLDPINVTAVCRTEDSACEDFDMQHALG